MTLRERLARLGILAILSWDMLALLLLAGGVIFLALWTGGCSSGPQLPITTPVVNVSCQWEGNACTRVVRADDGGVAPSRDLTLGSSCDCLIDRASSEAQARTTGNETGPVEVSPETQVSVPVAGGAAP